MFKVRCGGGRPADTHLRAEHLLQAGVHFLFLNKLAPVGLRNALSNGGPKAGIFLKQTQRGILYQSLSAGVCGRGNLCELGFSARG